jgi:signal transduction histidine kinase
MEPIQESASDEQLLLASEMRSTEIGAETPGTLQAEADGLAGIAHDACNMMTALGLYCELLDEPGVLRPAHRHYVNELRMVAASGRKLVEKLTGLRAIEFGVSTGEKFSSVRPDLATDVIHDLASELMANRNLLAAMAGPSISLEILPSSCHLPVRLSPENLTRILVNLIKNACEAMLGGGRIEITLGAVVSFSDTHSVRPSGVLLTVNDTGAGIPSETLDMIFESGYTTKVESHETTNNSWPSPHRGLGLAIVRSLVEEAGGTVNAESSIGKGTCFVIELPTVAQ